MRNCACAILLKKQSLLLGKRAPHRKAYSDRWDVIGGRVEDGEGLDDALVRELKEEVGVTPVVWENICTLVDSSSEAQGPAAYHLFAVRAWSGGEPAVANHEHSELRWFTVGEACALSDLALDDYRSVFGMIRL